MMHKRTFGLAAFTLSVLLAACGTTGPTPGPGGDPPGDQVGDAMPAELQGEWHYGSISPVEYYDPVSNQYAEASGTSMILKLGANGTFQRSGITVMTTGTCTSKILLSESGIVDLDGTVLTLIPKASLAKGYQCSPSNAFENRSLTNSVNTWKVTGSGAQAVLALGKPNDTSINDLYNRPRDAAGPGGQGGSISGHLTLAEGSGEELGDMVVMACPVDGGCGNQEKWRFTQFTSSGPSATFEIRNVPAEPYRVYAWNDLNGNRQADAGDLIGVYSTDGKAEATVTPPAQDLEITVEYAQPQ